MLYPVSPFTLRLSQLPRARLVAAHVDPVTIALAMLLILMIAVAWVCFVQSEGQVRSDKRQRHLVESMYRRRYSGCRLARVRSECRILYAGLVLTWRTAPRFVQMALIAYLGFAVSYIVAPVISGAFAALVSTARVRRLKTAGLAETLDAVDAAPLLYRLAEYRWYVGRKGYSLAALWRAYLASFVLGLPSTNALIRRLQDDPELRLLCGFNKLPHRTTFNRFIRRLDSHIDLVNDCLASLTDQLAEQLPGLGEKVAVDSTTVRSHSNPGRKNAAGQVSDPEASWTVKPSARSHDGREWHFGYKYHLMADATYGVPLYGYTTTASLGDSPELPNLLAGAKDTHEWLRPEYVMADKGYDSYANHAAVSGHGSVLICPARRKSNNALYEGIYTAEGVPTCLGMVPMEYVRSDPLQGHLYRCRPEGCYLKVRKGVRHCSDELWENRKDNPRLFGPLRQSSAAWKELYRMRQAVERTYKSLKESRRLERHYVRGLLRVALHAAMSTLSFSATYLVNLLAGAARPRWMVRKVA